MAWKNRSGSVRLGVTRLEDRSLPSSTPAENILATLSPILANGTGEAQLRLAPIAESVQSLGFDTYRIDLKAGTSEAEAITYFSGQPGIVMVGADTAIAVEATPNDPNYSSQWAFTAIGAAAAWNVTTGTGQTIVAVIDSGVDLTHPDLAANLLGTGYDFANNDSNPQDDFGHGTHVAGIVGATGNNGSGVTGVAWKTKILPIKFMNSGGTGYTGAAIQAIDYAIKNGAKIINASWGLPSADSFLAAALQRAQAAGVIVVSAAGNSGANLDSGGQYPAYYARTFDNVLAVAATDSNGQVPGWSNIGAGTVLLAAPGSSILSTTLGGGGGYKSGTSMAAPFVSGALALLWDLHPTWTYRQIIAKLKSSTDSLASLTGKVATGGELDLAELLDASPASPPIAVSNPGPRVTAANFSGSTANAFDTLTVTFNEAVNPATFTAEDLVLAAPFGRFNPTSISAVANSGNTAFQVRFNPIDFAGNYSVWLGPNVLDTAGRAMDQNANAVNGEATDRFDFAQTLAKSAAGNGLKVLNASFAGSRANTFDALTVTFDRPVDPATLTADDLVLAAPYGRFLPTSISADATSSIFTIRFPPQSIAGSYSVWLGPNVADASGRAMDQNGNGANGEATDRFDFAQKLSVVADSTNSIQRRTVDGPSGSIAIRDFITTRVQFNVAENLPVAEVQLALDLTHSRTGDLHIRLTSPDGRRVNLFNRAANANLANVTFGDPSGSFNGASSKGTWVLEIFDVVSGQSGTLRSATLGYGIQSTSQSLSLSAKADLPGGVE